VVPEKAEVQNGKEVVWLVDDPLRNAFLFKSKINIKKLMGLYF